MPKLPRWDKHEIKAAIGRKGMTLTGLARSEGISTSACRASLIKPSPAGDQAISRFIDVPLHVLWPDRYDANGNRLIPIKPRKKKSVAPPLAAE